MFSHHGGEFAKRTNVSLADFRLRQKAKEMGKDLEGIRSFATASPSLTLRRTREASKRERGGKRSATVIMQYIPRDCAFLFSI